MCYRRKIRPELASSIRQFETDTHDAMVVTHELYDGLLAEHEGREESDHHADLEWEPITADMVGNKWLVVVDYHT